MVRLLQGRKTESEKFAGAYCTYTTEALMGDARALQMGTSHHLGQNFSRAFNVTFLDQEGKREYPWSTSWAVTTRLIGALVMVHGDGKGLRLPPRIAPIQVVIVPIWRSDEQRAHVAALVGTVRTALTQAGIRVESDWRDQVTPGFKFNDWELRGVPLRLEIGPRDAIQNQVTAVRRDNPQKQAVDADRVVDMATSLLDAVQSSLFARAQRFLRVLGAARTGPGLLFCPQHQNSRS